MKYTLSQGPLKTALEKAQNADRTQGTDSGTKNALARQRRALKIFSNMIIAMANDIACWRANGLPSDEEIEDVIDEFAVLANLKELQDE